MTSALGSGEAELRSPRARAAPAATRRVVFVRGLRTHDTERAIPRTVLDRSVDDRRSPFPQTSGDPRNEHMGRRLFVGNLSYSTTQDALREALTEDGLVLVDVRVVTDRETGRPRGFAFVELGREEDVPRALEAWNGRMVDGRPLRVSQAEDRPPAGPRGPRPPGAGFSGPPRPSGPRPAGPPGGGSGGGYAGGGGSSGFSGGPAAGGGRGREESGRSDRDGKRRRDGASRREDKRRGGGHQREWDRKRDDESNWDD